MVQATASERRAALPSVSRGKPVLCLSHGTISDYLYRQKSEHETWSKLHQAAVGLPYVHSRHIVHGDLKCNNILVGDGRKAKVTDFGILFSVGAIRRKAPEVIQSKTRGALASDVYSLGMCIIEAVTGCLPWVNMPDVAVKTQASRQARTAKTAAVHESRRVVIDCENVYMESIRSAVH